MLEDPCTPQKMPWVLEICGTAKLGHWVARMTSEGCPSSALPCSEFWHVLASSAGCPLSMGDIFLYIYICPLIFTLFLILVKGVDFFFLFHYIFVNCYSIYVCLFSHLLFQFLTDTFLPHVSKFSVSVINFFPFPSCTSFSSCTTYKQAFFICYGPVLTHPESRMKVVLVLKFK